MAPNEPIPGVPVSRVEVMRSLRAREDNGLVDKATVAEVKQEEQQSESLLYVNVTEEFPFLVTNLSPYYDQEFPFLVTNLSPYYDQ